jgi:hypothetical protein
MAYPSVTYTFTNGTTASATEVNQNFTDLINGLSDGTKDLSISALTVAGTASLNGAVNIGNATSDDIAVNGYITTALIPKADDSVDLGTAALAWQDGYFDGNVYTDSIKALTAAGVTITDDGGVACVACADGGAVTVGPAVTGNITGQRHLISGAIWSANVTSTDQSGRLYISNNARNGANNGENGRTDSTTGGVGILFNNRTSDTNNVLEIIANKAGESTATSGAAIATATQAGAWTLGPASGSTAVRHQFWGYDTGGSGDQCRFFNRGAVAGQIGIGGSGYSTTYMLIGINSSGNNIVSGTAGQVYQGNNSTTWSTTSDERIKTNIRDINDGLDKICSLRPRHFEYKNAIGTVKTGFVAQEFEQVLPGHVRTQEVTSECEFAEYLPDLTLKSIDADLIPYLVKAIQDLSAKLDEANARIAALEAK